MEKWTSLMLALLMMSVAVGAFAESQDTDAAPQRLCRA